MRAAASVFDAAAAEAEESSEDSEESSDDEFDYSAIDGKPVGVCSVEEPACRVNARHADGTSACDGDLMYGR